MLDLAADSQLYRELASRTRSRPLRARIARELKAFWKMAAHPDLAHDVDSLFAGTRAGHVLRHVFNNAAMHLYDEFAENVPGYMATEEIGLIGNNYDYFAGIGYELHKRANGRPVTMIEIGTGKKHAQTYKSIPTAQAIKPEVVIGLDYSAGSALEYAIAMQEFNKTSHTKPPIAVDMRIRDYIQHPYGIMHEGPRFFAMYGNTVANLEGFSNALPYDEMNRALSNVRRHMNPMDYFVLGLDQQDAEDKSYQHLLFHKFHEHFLKHLKESLHEDSNFKPDDFTFFVRWDPRVSNHVFGYRAKREGWVQPLPGGPRRDYSQGDEFITCNSWRFQQGFLDRAYKNNGFAVERIIKRPEGQVSLQVLKAV